MSQARQFGVFSACVLPRRLAVPPERHSGGTPFLLSGRMSAHSRQRNAIAMQETINRVKLRSERSAHFASRHADFLRRPLRAHGDNGCGEACWRQVASAEEQSRSPRRRMTDWKTANVLQGDVCSSAPARDAPPACPLHVVGAVGKAPLIFLHMQANIIASPNTKNPKQPRSNNELRNQQT